MPWDPARPRSPAGVPARGLARGLAPAAGDVHLWPVEITAADDWLPLLACAERVRAARITAAGPRDTFVVSRALQRLVMSHYLGCAPGDVMIRRRCAHCGSADHGRPSAGPGAPDYSVSHSGAWAVLAVAGSGRVGADLERRGLRHADIALLAGATLDPAERAEFRSLPAAGRPGWFYRMWTRKEAVLKATGQGLTMPVSALDVRTSPVAVPPADGRAGALMHVRDLAAPQGYAAALATTEAVRALHWCRPAPPLSARRGRARRGRAGGPAAARTGGRAPARRTSCPRPGSRR